MNDQERSLRFHAVHDEGGNKLSFVHCRGKNGTNHILCGRHSNDATHTLIYELAVDEGLIDESCEPVGGGTFNARTGEFVRGSFHYGDAEECVVDAIQETLWKCRGGRRR